VFVEELEKKEGLGNLARWERKREGRQIFKSSSVSETQWKQKEYHLPGEIVAPKRLESLR
jgi:hypothetical protein